MTPSSHGAAARLDLGVALNDAGWHPAAWRAESARPAELFTGRYWADLARTADDAGFELLTIEDAFGLQTRSPFGAVDPADTDQVRGRLDAVLLANWLAPVTKRIGLIPTVNTTHTEPFHVSTAIATLDYASRGRAGVRPVASAKPHEAAHVGRRTFPEFDVANYAGPEAQALISEWFGEAADAIEVARRLWDSWQDDAIIRDRATGRFIDRDRLHYIDFEGAHFSVKGPSIVPRPPQGQPVVALLAHQRIPYELAARQGDVVFITPHDDAQLASITAEVRDAETRVERVGEPLRVWADLVVLIEETTDAAQTALAHLDGLAGDPFASDALIVSDTAEGVAERLLAWHAAGAEGIRLRPARLPLDLDRIAQGVVPLLDAAGVRSPRADDPAATLRARLGLPAAVNRYEIEEVA
ncbi:LLM class flavin-dependent oxidoreductase [Gryllotalpicola protaetiae]|uniref:LLM class flavin-dependent oxidoreductase n=1 Tax=Gryllotalpicola protaetiae TaxID=2419771 RepID=A0A387BSH0_9MICO|nr:LLM class flavin-dependent oxidoreductase [Gryllotalpicola protaetiae]AYG03966.1 LLM class flavin-dependent oxidoreductase [Gryllotalpicola protaetiae]